MADPRNIKILGTVEAKNDSSIILSGSNTYIKKVLDDGTVLFHVAGNEVIVSGNLMLSASQPLNNVPLTADNMYNAELAIRTIDQSIETKAAIIRNAYEAVRFRHFGTLGPYGLTRLNLTQLATSGSDYFASDNLKDITVDLLIDSNNDGVYKNDMASIHLFVSGGNLYADIDAPSAAGNPFRFIAVNETLLDVINTSASYNTPGITNSELTSALASYAKLSDISSQLVAGDNVTISGNTISSTGGITAQQITSALTPYATTSSVSSSFVNKQDFTNEVRGQFTAGSNISISNGVISSNNLFTIATASLQIEYSPTKALLLTRDPGVGTSNPFTLSVSNQTGTLTFRSASSTECGFVSIGNQNFNGSKTFDDKAYFDNGIRIDSGQLELYGGTLIAAKGAILGDLSDASSYITMRTNRIDISNETLDFGPYIFKIDRTNNYVSASKYIGDGSSLTKVTASYVATGSAIATFTNDVRNQFRAGNNLQISNGVISYTGSSVSGQEVSASFAQLNASSVSFVGNVTSSKDMQVYGARIGRGHHELADTLFIGGQTGRNVYGAGIVAIGYAALSGGTVYGSSPGAAQCTAVGSYALNKNVAGIYNAAFGSYALNALTGGSGVDNNTAIGSLALGQLPRGANNIAIGMSAGYGLSSQTDNTIIIGSNGGHVNGKHGSIVLSNLLTAYTNSNNPSTEIYNIYLSGSIRNMFSITASTGIAFGDGTVITSSNAFVGSSVLSSYVSSSNFTSSLRTAIGANNLSSSQSASIHGINISNGNSSQNNIFIALQGSKVYGGATGGYDNVGIGKAVTFWTAVGDYGIQNVSIGSNTFSNAAAGNYGEGTGGSDNVSIGYYAANAGTSAHRNVAIGSFALSTNKMYHRNTAVGYGALQYFVYGTSNVAMGYNAGTSLITGSYNVIIGGNNGSSINNTDNNVIISDGQGRIKLTADSNNNVTVPSGSLTVTGSVNVTSVIKLTAQNPLPAGTVGMMAVSGTNLYFHNGTAWTMVI